MPSPICLINGTSTTDGYTASTLSILNITLADTTGVNSWYVSVIGTDHRLTVASENTSLVYNTDNRNYTYTANGSEVDPESSVIFRSIINDGIDIDGSFNNDYITTFIVRILTSEGNGLVASNESTELGNFGWISDINAIITNGVLIGGNISTTDQTINITTSLGALYINENFIYRGTGMTEQTITAATYTINLDVILFLNSSGTTITLPSVEAGRLLYIIDIAGNAHTVIGAGEKINNSTSPYNILANKGVNLICNGTDWFVI